MKNKPLILAGALCAVCVAWMIVALALGGGQAQQAEFVPPPFDDAARAGSPTVPEALGWSEIAPDGLSFRALLCGRPALQDDGALSVYFTSPAENTVWLKLRVYDQGGALIGETGLIRPGEYVQSVRLNGAPEDGAQIRLKIMAYEMHSYYSAGAVSMNTALTAQ